MFDTSSDRRPALKAVGILPLNGLQPLDVALLIDRAQAWSRLAYDLRRSVRMGWSINPCRAVLFALFCTNMATVRLAKGGAS